MQTGMNDDQLSPPNRDLHNLSGRLRCLIICDLIFGIPSARASIHRSVITNLYIPILCIDRNAPNNNNNNSEKS